MFLGKMKYAVSSAFCVQWNYTRGLKNDRDTTRVLLDFGGFGNSSPTKMHHATSKVAYQYSRRNLRRAVFVA